MKKPLAVGDCFQHTMQQDMVMIKEVSNGDVRVYTVWDRFRNGFAIREDTMSEELFEQAIKRGLWRRMPKEEFLLAANLAFNEIDRIRVEISGVIIDESRDLAQEK